MSNPKCAACGKTAYPLESVTALDKAYHKGCFKCSVCHTAVNLKNFKGVEGKIYCATHTPKPTATSVTDSIAVKQALNAPKKTAEGLSTVQKGTGEKPKVGLDTISTQQALKAPKKTSEGLRTVQKGDGGKPNYAVFGADGSAPAEASAASGEAHAEQHYEEPAAAEHYEEPAAEQQYEEPAAAEQQYEEQQYEEQPAEGYEQQQYEGQYEEQPAEEEQQE